MTETGFGVCYEVHGELETPAGPRSVICTVWQLDAGKTAPRLITAYPVEASCSKNVVLRQDLPGDRLVSGYVGTIIHIHGNVSAYEVEFATLTGQTIAVATVLPTQCRPIGNRDINHVREVQAA